MTKTISEQYKNEICTPSQQLPLQTRDQVTKNSAQSHIRRLHRPIQRPRTHLPRISQQLDDILDPIGFPLDLVGIRLVGSTPLHLPVVWLPVK